MTEDEHEKSPKLYIVAPEGGGICLPLTTDAPAASPYLAEMLELERALAAKKLERLNNDSPPVVIPNHPPGSKEDYPFVGQGPDYNPQPTWDKQPWRVDVEKDLDTFTGDLAFPPEPCQGDKLTFEELQALDDETSPRYGYFTVPEEEKVLHFRAVYSKYLTPPPLKEDRNRALECLQTDEETKMWDWAFIEAESAYRGVLGSNKLIAIAFEPKRVQWMANYRHTNGAYTYAYGFSPLEAAQRVVATLVAYLCNQCG